MTSSFPKATVTPKPDSTQSNPDKHGTPQINRYLDPGWSWVKLSRKTWSPGPAPTQHSTSMDEHRANKDLTPVPPRQLPGANTVATQTVSDYPDLKNPPGRSWMTPAILKSLKLPGWCPWPWQTIQDYPDPTRIWPRIGQISVQAVGWTGTWAWFGFLWHAVLTMAHWAMCAH